jgi:hypothetical protein
MVKSPNDAESGRYGATPAHMLEHVRLLMLTPLTYCTNCMQYSATGLPVGDQQWSSLPRSAKNKEATLLALRF